MLGRPLLAVLLVAMPLAFAGCLASEGEDDPVAPANALAEAVPSGLLVAHEGSFGSPVTVCPILVCVSGDVYGPTNRWFPQEASGQFSQVNLTLTWAASSALMEALILGLVVCTNECATSDDVTLVETARGSSPVTLTLSDVTVGEGETAYVFASVPGRTPLVYAAVATPQAFSIEGAFVPAIAQITAEAETPAPSPEA